MQVLDVPSRCDTESHRDMALVASIHVVQQQQSLFIETYPNMDVMLHLCSAT